jgi:uncharacterized membrane protein
MAHVTPDSLSSSLKRNIRALEDRRRQQAAAATWEERIAEAITRFTGSMRFVYLHVVLFGAWFLVNLGVVPGVPRFDPSFVVLAMVASVEAIFLSTFVLISQNRMAERGGQAGRPRPAHQPTEHELTKLTGLVTTIAERLGAEANADPRINEVTKDVAPEAVLDEIKAQQDPQ